MNSIKNEHIRAMTVGKKSLFTEASAIQDAADRVGDSLCKAAELILSSNEKRIIFLGLGKSGLIAQKIAATFRSIGFTAVFVHATEAVHGDFGIYKRGDVTIMLSKSGTTPELLALIPLLRRFESTIIGILGNINTGLVTEVDCVIDSSVKKEAEPLNLLPTASSTVAIALGDAIAATLIEKMGFSHEDFGLYHPGGQLGKNLEHRVADVMHTDVLSIAPNVTLKDAVIAMSYRPLGAVCVVKEGILIGIITDGDIRRAIQNNIKIDAAAVSEIMKHEPIYVSPNAHLRVALDLMENRPSQISVLPVVTENKKVIGLIRLHDIYQVTD